MASTWFWLAAWAVVASGEKLAPHHAFARLLTEAERETLRAADTAMRVLSHGAEETVHELEKHRKFMLSALEQQLHGIIDNPGWALEKARQAINEADQQRLSLPIIAPMYRRLTSVVGWSRARRLIRHGKVEDLSGTWSLEERHDMDKFLRSMGFSSLQRLAVLKAGQVQVIRRQDDHLHIITRDMRGTSELVLPLNGPSVRGEGDGGKSVSRRAFADGNDLVITETVANEREPLSVCRRSLRDDGKLCVDIKKKTADGQIASMRIVYTPIKDDNSDDSD